MAKLRTALGALLGRRKTLLAYLLCFRNGEVKCREIMTWLKLRGGPLTVVGCESWFPDPQTITGSSRSWQLLCWVSFGGRCVADVNHCGALAAASEMSFALEPVIHPCVAVVKMCSSLQSLELTSWFLKANPFTLFPVPDFAFGSSSLFSQLHLVLKAYGAAGLKNQK